MNPSKPSEAHILETLREVVDPEIGCNIVDLGLVYSVVCDGGHVTVLMTLTTPGCPMHESIRYGVENALSAIEGITSMVVRLVWEPRWDPSMMTDAGRAFIQSTH